MRRRGLACFLALSLLVFSGCGSLKTLGQETITRGGEYLTGNEAEQKFLQSMSWSNFEGMREAVEAGRM